MRKKFYIFAALLAIAAVSCQKEQLKPEKEPVEETPGTEIGEVPEGSVVFTARIAPGKTRTVIGEAERGDYQPLWTDSDRIIVNNVLSTKTVVLDDGQSARFTVPGVSAPYHVLSPGNKFGQDILTYDEEAGTYRYLINGAASPHVYTTNGEYPTYPANMAVIAAYGATEDDVDLQFRHLSVYFKITVDAANSVDSENIRYIYVRQGLDGDGNSELTAGYWTATYTDADHITQVPSTLSSAITLSCGDEGVAHGTPMIIAVPVYDYPDGLIITLKDVSGHFASYAIEAEKTQFATDGAAGTIFDFTPKFSPGSGIINNAADWELFAAAMNSTKDFDVYRWVGNGTVKLGATKLSGTDFTKISRDFPYIFDGQDNTIERTEGIGALFLRMSGTVKNLKLAGKIESATNRVSALVDSLYYGAKIEYCDNAVDITTSGSYGIVGGLAAVMAGGTISHCSNAGDITVHVDCSDADSYHLQAGGIVGTINNTLSQKHGDATVEYCTNSGAITGDPICTKTDVTNSSTYGGIWNTNVGGIVASARGTNHKITIDNCLNEGNVTLSGDNVKEDDGMKYNAIFAGGILGSAVEMVQYGTPRTFYLNTTTGLDIAVTSCTNTGTVRNCGANNAQGTQSMRKVFTGGIAGSVFGTSTKSATLSGCLNEGKVLTYDIASGDTVDEVELTPFKYPIRNQVAGGLLGAAGYVEIDDCDVNCEIGNGRRQSFSVGGAIGLAFKAFNIHDCTVWVISKIVRNNSYTKYNSAVLAAVPLKYGSSTISGDALPDITGTIVKNNKGGMEFNNLNLAGDDDITDQSVKTFSRNILSTATINGHFVRGTKGNNNESAATGSSLGIQAEDYSGNTGINAYPAS